MAQNWKCLNCGVFNPPNKEECWNCRQARTRIPFEHTTSKGILIRNPSRRKKLPKEVQVALVTGSLGLLSVVLTALFGYIGILAPIQATQTAEAGLKTFVPTSMPAFFAVATTAFPSDTASPPPTYTPYPTLTPYPTQVPPTATEVQPVILIITATYFTSTPANPIIPTVTPSISPTATFIPTATLRPCPTGVGPSSSSYPSGIVAGDYPPESLTQEQRQWLFGIFGNPGIASVGYGGERCQR